jgi:type IV secretory pathway protease TraF
MYTETCPDAGAANVARTQSPHAQLCFMCGSFLGDTVPYLEVEDTPDQGRQKSVSNLSTRGGSVRTMTPPGDIKRQSERHGRITGFLRLEHSMRASAATQTGVPEGTPVDASIPVSVLCSLLLGTDGCRLRPWPEGVYRVEEGTIWVLSTYNISSYDSRYFGPIELSSVLRYGHPVWQFSR